MAVRYFTKLVSGDPVLDRIQDLIATILNPLSAAPSNHVTVLQNVSLQTGANAVAHTLGRALIGWRIVRIRSAATVFDTQDSGKLPTKFLYLTASAPVVVDIEVF